MSGGDDRHGKGPVEEAPEEDKFPEGLRVLAVDNDPVFLRVLGFLLRVCKYKATTVTDARMALDMLREGGEEQFDLVITDLHMPNMDGFKLLEIIGLEMDLPVIMLSMNGEKETVYKGILHGACDYLVKPVKIKELKNIWQHVARKNQVAMNHDSSESDDDADQRMVQPVTVVHGQGGAKKSNKRSKNKKNGVHDSYKNRRIPTTQKKPRVSWTGALHNRFIKAVNRLGVDKAVPKAILRMMNVKNLSRESVASHLQKYRHFLKWVGEEPEKYNPVVDSSNEMDMNPPIQPSSVVCCCGSNIPCSAPSTIGPHGLSIQPSNRSMGNGRSMARNAAAWQPETSRRRASDRPMLDVFHPNRSTKAYVGVLREKLLEASSMVPASHPSNSSVEEMSDGEPATNQFPVQVQPPELISQNVEPSSFPGPMNGAPVVVPTQANMLQINQLPSFGASPGQMVVFQNGQQNQMAGIFSNNNNATTPVAGFSEQMMPFFNIASNRGPVEMTQMMVSGGSASSPFPSLGTGSSVGPPPSQMANGGGISSSLPILRDNSVRPEDGGDASGILPMQDGPADQQSPGDDQLTPSTDLLLQQIFSSMVNQDINPDDAFFGEEY
uniref:Uncharacterized protein n=2 Tax=Avena sativa TaxID=4498 RepID=A0ACD5V4G5_AVESA